MFKRKFSLLLVLPVVVLISSTGCQLTGGQTAQPFANSPVYQSGQSGQPGYEQTFPPGQPPRQPAQFASQAGQFVGSLASGFARSVVGGAGFTAGRDLWNEIIH